jgi:hypothetical protein
MLKLTAVKIFRAVFCALQKVSFSAQNGQSFQACLFPLVLLINISFEVIFFYGFHRLLYTTVKFKAFQYYFFAKPRKKRAMETAPASGVPMVFLP